jgi:Acyl-CoA dehydrogenase, C-terminal domain
MSLGVRLRRRLMLKKCLCWRFAARKASQSDFTASYAVVKHDDGVYVEAVKGVPEKSAAGDYLVRYEPSGKGDKLGDVALVDRLERYAALVNSARIIGAGQELLQYGVNYAGEREQFGTLIGAYQGVAHRLANVAGALDAAELLVRKAAFSAMPEHGGDGAPMKHFAIMVWAKAASAGRFAATNVHQVFGGAGFSLEYNVQLYSRRIRSWAMRGPRTGQQLVDLARMALNTQSRDKMRMLWHFDKGMPLPRWAQEVDIKKRTRDRCCDS